MSEYETDPDWSYMGMTVEDRRGVPLSRAYRRGADTSRLRAWTRGLRVTRSAVRQDGPLMRFHWEWEHAYAREQQRVRDNRTRWRTETEPRRSERTTLVARTAMEHPSRLNRSALVVYRCKSHGCLLGAVLPVNGERYQLCQQRVPVGFITGDEIDEWGDAMTEGIAPMRDSSLTAKILTETEPDMDYEKDGYWYPGRDDWEPESLSEWLTTGRSDEETSRLYLQCTELPPWVSFYDTIMNCRHVEYRPSDETVRADIQALWKKRKRVIDVDNRGPVTRGK